MASISGSIGDEDSCKKFYLSNKFKAAQAAILCSNGSNPVTNPLQITKFNFYTNPKETCKAWMNIFLNNQTYNPADYADLLFLMNITSTELTKLIYSTTNFTDRIQ